MIQSSDFRVKVTRYHEEKGHPVYSGIYVSKVYAIDGNSFLVWDPGDWLEPCGFTWVNFTEMMIPMGATYFDEERTPVVELVEDEDEQQE